MPRHVRKFLYFVTIIFLSHVLRYESTAQRRVSHGFFGMVENFTAADEYGVGAGGSSFVPSNEMRALQKEQRKFLRAVLSVSDPIR